MKTTFKPLVLTGVILAIIIAAVFGILIVLDIGNRAELQEAFVKALTTIAILIVASLGIWGIVRLISKD